MDKPSIKSDKTDSEIIIELCEIIFYQQKRIEELADNIKYLTAENSTLKSENN